MAFPNLETYRNLDRPWMFFAGARAPVDSTNDNDGMYWELRLSILPEKTNLDRAFSALKQVLEPQVKNPNHPKLKIVKLQSNPATDEESVDLSGWDGTLGDALDRDQRGKEICIYLPYDSKNKKFQFSGPQLKDLMLNLWKAMEDNGVILNYKTPDLCEKEISADFGILTPYSYSSFKPYKSAEGILQATSYNSQKYPNPLEDVHVSFKDLQEKGIQEYDAVLIAKKRLVYLNKHYSDRFEAIKAQALSIYNLEKSPFQQLMEQLNAAHLKGDDESIQGALRAVQKSINEDAKILPTTFVEGNRKSLVTLGTAPFEYIDNWSVLFNDATLEQRKNTLQKIIELINQEVKTVERQLLKSISYGFIGDAPKSLVEKDPYSMQSIYRQAVHLQHERTVIQIETNRLVFINKKQELLNKEIASCIKKLGTVFENGKDSVAYNATKKLYNGLTALTAIGQFSQEPSEVETADLTPLMFADYIEQCKTLIQDHLPDMQKEKGLHPIVAALKSLLCKIISFGCWERGENNRGVFGLFNDQVRQNFDKTASSLADKIEDYTATVDNTF